MTAAPHKHRVVIVGGGFGGLYAAQRLRRVGAEVTVVDRRNFHLFQPLLYQVATGGLSPANIASPLRSVLRRQKNVEVMMAEVVDIDAGNRRLVFRDANLPPLEYDTLVVAAGSDFNYFGHDEWQRVAPGLKRLEDATEIRARVLRAFERAEVETNPERQKALLTFAVVGGGPTGVELSGAVAELARYTLRRDFRRIDPTQARVLLFEAGPTILSMFSEELRAKAQASLLRIGVQVRTGVTVTDIRSGELTIKDSNVQDASGEKTLAAETILWTAGIKASLLGKKLAAAVGLEVDRAGRVPVEPDCTLKGHPEIFVIGDLADFHHQGGRPLPALAPVAMQQGRYVAEVIAARLSNQGLDRPFHYRDKGTLATIGRSAAVAELGWLKLSGFPAWITWLLVHLMYLVQFHNRVLVLIQWGYNYFSRGRAARLITDEGCLNDHGDAGKA